MTTATDVQADVQADLEAAFARAGAVGFVHARDVDGDREVGLGPDEPVVTASTFKVPLVLEVFAQAAEGRFALTDRVRVPVEGRAAGPTGLSVLRDEVELSIRDLALSTITVSDNAATDVLCDLVGLDAVERRLRGLGLERTRLPHDCRAIYRTIDEDAAAWGLPVEEALESERIAEATCLDPARTNASTPREMTDLLARIWRDEAAAPEACAEVRHVMALQVWPHRLTAGFPPDVALAGKTGTLPSAHNEVAVVTYPDGGRYAVAVFTRSSSFALRQPLLDRAIGEAGRIAVEALRG